MYYCSNNYLDGMPRYNFWHVLLFVLLITPGCSPNRIPQETQANDRIVFGQGGGITGIRIEYVLQKEGYLLRQHAFGDSTTLLGRMDGDFVKQTFNNFGTLGLDTVSCNNPGDLYYYIEMHAKDKVHTLVWGYPGFKPEPAIVQYFNNLYRTAKRYQQ